MTIYKMSYIAYLQEDSPSICIYKNDRTTVSPWWNVLRSSSIDSTLRSAFCEDRWQRQLSKYTSQLSHSQRHWNKSSSRWLEGQYPATQQQLHQSTYEFYFNGDWKKQKTFRPDKLGKSDQRTRFIMLGVFREIRSPVKVRRVRAQ